MQKNVANGQFIIEDVILEYSV